MNASTSMDLKATTHSSELVDHEKNVTIDEMVKEFAYQNED